MRFSLVIPTYNRAAYIERAILSAIGQRYPHLEIIVVDDGSTDNTAEVVGAIHDERIRYFRISNSERAFARNYGNAKATGDYITFLDSDDILLPGYFYNAAESIAKYGNPPFLHLGYEIVNTDNKLLFKVDRLKNDDIYCLIRGNPLSCTGCFLRADVAKTFHFNEDRNLSGSEDWELWFRVLARHGIKTDNRISARMFNHENRSVMMQSQEQKLVMRKELALRYAFRDQAVQSKYSGYYKEIDAFGDGYIALHLALLGDRRRSIYYTMKFLKSYPFGIFSKRFLVIIKQILLN